MPEAPNGCYHLKDRVWRLIAASIEDEHGNEIPDPDAVAGSFTRHREWRFHGRDVADRFAESIGAEPSHPIADLPHRCNGFVVSLREPVAEWHAPIEADFPRAA